MLLALWWHSFFYPRVEGKKVRLKKGKKKIKDIGSYHGVSWSFVSPEYTGVLQPH